MRNLVVLFIHFIATRIGRARRGPETPFSFGLEPRNTKK
jgi:hypothetical protein